MLTMTLRPDGFTLEQLGDKSVGYPLTKGNLGNLMTFKLNKYRHVNCDRLGKYGVLATLSSGR